MRRTRVSATIDLIDSTISGSSAKNANGGGIYNAGGKLTVTGSTISGNSARGNSGGGIYNHIGMLTVTGSTIGGNPGGGIYTDATLTVTDSTIKDNSGGLAGGGIYISENSGNIAMINSTLSGNSAGDSGGAIYAGSGTTLSVDGSTLSRNWTRGTNGRVSGGGGIFIQGTLSVIDSTISGNAADFSNGGGIYNLGTVRVADSTISGNAAGGGSGGGICNLGTLSIAKSTISGNGASNAFSGGGGGIFNEGTLSVTDCTISDNRTIIDGGGGIFNGGMLSVAGSTISGNSAFNDGGAIYNTDRGTLSVTGSTISGNRAGNGIGGAGGAIANNGKLSITGSTISGNQASGGGGAIVNDGTLSMTGSTISGNSADAGGGIYNSGTLSFVNGAISGNAVSYDGGGIYNSSGMLNMTNSTLVANRADRIGAGSDVSGASPNAVPLWDDGGGRPSGVGGGLAGDADNVTVNNTIIAGNFRGTGLTADDISWNSGTITAASHNLVGDAASSGGIANGVNGNIVGVSDLTTIFVDVNNDGKINASDLADNGGPTETYAPAPGSPAINAGDNSLVPAGITTDQRGAGYDRFVGTVDIGAVEEQNHSPTVSNLTVKTDENLAIVLSSDVFEGGYADAESDPMAAVRIDSLPADGVLLLDGQAVSAGEVVSRADLAGLAYQPGQNYSGNDSFSFSASDGISFAETDATLTVDVLTPRQALNDLIDHVAQPGFAAVGGGEPLGRSAGGGFVAVSAAPQ